MTEFFGDYSNQGQIFDPSSFHWPVNVIGLGSAGSATTLALHSMGVRKLVGFDDDVVSPHNVPVQVLYSNNDLTDPPTTKVDAVQRYLAGMPIDSQQTFTGHNRRVTRDNPFDLFGVVVMTVDTMAARHEIWELIQRPETLVNVPLVIDTRMDGGSYQVHTINPQDPDHVKKYQSWFYTDEEADNEGYGLRGYVGVTFSLAGRVASHIAAFSRGEVCPTFYQDLVGPQVTPTEPPAENAG